MFIIVPTVALKCMFTSAIHVFVSFFTNFLRYNVSLEAIQEFVTFIFLMNALRLKDRKSPAKGDTSS